MSQNAGRPAPEFHRSIEIAAWDRRERQIRFEANPEERCAIADYLGLVSLDRLDGEARIRPWRNGGAILEGRLTAVVAQTCIVTLEPVTSTVDQEFERRYLPEDRIAREQADLDARDVEVELTAEDPPEPLVGGRIELGDAVVEELSLGLDPFPRCEGAELEQPKDAEDLRPHPFAALKQLKRDG